jgi:hypothetical protein
MRIVSEFESEQLVQMLVSIVGALFILFVEMKIATVQVAVASSGLLFGMSVGFAFSMYSFHNWYTRLKGKPIGKCESCGQPVYERDKETK